MIFKQNKINFDEYVKYHGNKLLPFLLKAPELLKKDYYDGNATIGQRGLLATIYGDFVTKFGGQVHFVFPYGEAKQGMINIAFNINHPECVFRIDGEQPSKRSIRKALEEI